LCVLEMMMLVHRRVCTALQHSADCQNRVGAKLSLHELAQRKCCRISLVLQAHNVTFDVAAAAATDKHAVPLKEWASSRYIMHLRGRSYSASLKLQMLLSSPVIAVLSPCEEFYYGALVPGKHFVQLPTPLALATSKPVLDAVMDGPAAEANAQRIGAAGRIFVRDELSKEVVDCYWAAALIRYGRRYAELQAVL
jgi:Glycosyl transferase family 90